MSCYLCGSDKYTIRQTGVRDDPLINVHECLGCGLVYLSYFEHVPNRVHRFRDIKTWEEHTAQDDIRRAYQFEDVTINKDVLDLGCGNGGFIRHAIAKSACGIEIDQKAITYCIAHNTPVYGSLDEVGTFDVITMFHVIEHIPDPIGLLKELSSHLNNGGNIILETPNSDDALLTLYKCSEFSEFTYWSEHPFLFNKDTIFSVAANAGYSVGKIEQYQRYPLANHLYWLSQGKPNGHNEWSFIRDTHYSKSLAALNKCDTIIAILEKP